MQKSDRLVLVLMAGGVLVMLLWMMRAANLLPSSNSPHPGFGLAPGAPAPAIKAEGWINGEAPTEESLRGKVVVVNAWAYWCGYCMQDAPELITLYKSYERQDDVVFVGLTAEGVANLSDSREFVKQAGYPWANGYGAFDTMLQYGNNYLPAAWVIGRDGKVTWNLGMEHIESMKEAIDRALATSPPNTAPTVEEGAATADSPKNAADSLDSTESTTE
ncbi:TlpA family protein disulfide reductase [Symmachiella macrocystis]|nr:TlpA disulfide reductase family protein [Symmachiella macrocystis]